MKVFVFNCVYGSDSKWADDEIICLSRPQLQMSTPSTLKFTTTDRAIVGKKFKYIMEIIGDWKCRKGIDINNPINVYCVGSTEVTYDIKTVISYSISEKEMDLKTVDEANIIISESEKAIDQMVNDWKPEFDYREEYLYLTKNPIVKFIMRFIK